jgi:hypothetical protein
MPQNRTKNRTKKKIARKRKSHEKENRKIDTCGPAALDVAGAADFFRVAFVTFGAALFRFPADAVSGAAFTLPFPAAWPSSVFEALVSPSSSEGCRNALTGSAFRGSRFYDSVSANNNPGQLFQIIEL